MIKKTAGMETGKVYTAKRTFIVCKNRVDRKRNILNEAPALRLHTFSSN